MTLAKKEQLYQFKALTDLWTGDLNGKPDRLITTGLLGSIRWWFEVLVRGLGGDACDPSDTKCEDRSHCVVCEFFGCTGWSRKFRFEALDETGKIKTNQIKQDKPFSLRFTPLRPICGQEWTLLDATLRLIAEYGAIGGKTVFKPTDEQGRQRETHHRDYGLIEINQTPKFDCIELNVLKTYLSASQWRKVHPKNFAWASIQHFWCVNGGKYYLARQNSNISTFNRIISRPESKRQKNQNDSWIAGRRPDPRNNIEAESKKVFSFKNPARTFGFVEQSSDFTAMRQKLENPKVWGKTGWDFLKGDEIIDQLFTDKEDRP